MIARGRLACSLTLVLGVLAAIAALAPAAAAALLNVRDFPSPAAALAAAHDGDRVYFPSPGPYQAPPGGWSIALATRTFATPGHVGWYYYDYFSKHEQYHLSHSFLSWLFTSPYSVDAPLLIGSVYFHQGTDANTSLRQCAGK